MASTGTYDYFSTTPASALTLMAFDRIGIRRTELTTQHLSSAAVEANLLQVALGANQPNLWRSSVYQINLVAGTATYDLPARMIAVQDVYINTTSGNSSVDRLVFPLTLFEYDAQPNKTQQAPPTAYLIQKIIPTPTITFWQVPDDTATYVANVRILTQIQDASQTQGTTLDMPYIYMDVYVAGLAYRMARIYAKDQEVMRKADYQEALDIAAKTDTQDNTSIYIMPAFSSYMR